MRVGEAARERAAAESVLKKEEAKGKRESQAADERKERLHAIGARQNLGSIIQKNTFVGEDVRPVEEGGEDPEEEEGEGDVDEDESEEGDELRWNDVFPEDAPPPRQSDDDASEDGSTEEDDQVEGGSGFLSLEAYG